MSYDWIAIGVIAAVCIAQAGLWFYSRRTKRREHAEHMDQLLAVHRANERRRGQLR